MEVKSLNIIDGGTFTINDLPTGNYDIVASSYGKDTKIYSVTVIASGPVELEISL